MNAQAFFEMCRGVTEAGTLQQVTSFGNPDNREEDDFLDEEDDFLEEDDFHEEDNSIEEDSTVEKCVSQIKNITIEQLEENTVSDGTLYSYFKDWLRTNINAKDDLITAWNNHSGCACDDIEECVRAFVLMHFGINFVGDTSILQLHASELSNTGLPCAVTVEEYFTLKSADCDMYDLQLLSQSIDVDTAEKLIIRTDYDRNEALQYVNNPEAFQLYIELKLKGCFIKEKFETALCRTSGDGLLRDNYFDQNSILFEIVADIGLVELLQNVLDKGENITPDYLRTFKDAGLLQTVLTARLNGVSDNEVEQLMLRSSTVPTWCASDYCKGVLVNGNKSKSLAYCCASAECESRNIDYNYLEDSQALAKLEELHHTCRIADAGYLKLLYCLTRGVDVSDMIFSTFKSFDHFWITKVLEDVGIEASIPGFVGDMIVVVNAEGKIKLLDVETIVYDYDKFRNSVSSDYQVELLHGNRGVLLIHDSKKALIPRLIGIHYAAQSSLDRWTNGLTKSFGDPGRCNLYELEEALGDSIPEGLRSWEKCPLRKYQQADRCFGYVLNVVSEAKYLFKVKDTQRVIRSVLAGVQITDKTTFAWHFLKNFFNGDYNCKVFEKSKKKEYTTDEVTVELDGQISRISLESFFMGFDGIAESVKTLGSIALDNSQGRIYVKICKKFL